MKKMFGIPLKTIISFFCILIMLINCRSGTAAAADPGAAGVIPSREIEARQTDAENHYDDGYVVYEIEFSKDNREYEYKIDAVTGTVREYDWEWMEGTGSTAIAKITLDAAKETALSDAGLTAAQVTFKEMKLDAEHGIAIYEIEFYTLEYEYEYEINAATGAIHSRKVDTRRTDIGNHPSHIGNVNAYIGVDQAKTIAVSHAGLSASELVFSKTRLDHEDGYTVYEIEFYKDSIEYEYKIDAITGAVLKSDREWMDGADNTPTAQITLDAAKKTALSDAGLAASEVIFTKMKLDVERNVTLYEIEFYALAWEYEYEINASTGAVHSKKAEVRQTGMGNLPGNEGTTEAYIGIERAKSIVTDHAGFSVLDITFTKEKLKYDHSYMVYEIEFYKNGIEYEYKVHAVTGAIMEYDSEWYDYFHGSSGLETITLPEGATHISAYAFHGCSSLKTIVLPKDIVSIGENAFQDCQSLTTIQGYKGSYAEQYAKEQGISFESIAELLTGDVNGDGSIDLFDVQLVLKAALRIAPLTSLQQQRADVDGTAGISLKDAQLILKRALRIII